MFSKGKLFAAILFSASTLAGGLTAQTATAPLPPTAPMSPQRIEREMQFFTNDGGSYLGVQTQDINKDNLSKYGLREVRGVAVEKVMENSPAASAGLQTGDVIVRFNGEEVTSARKLTRLIGEVAPDHQARITVLRNGSEREITATLGKRPTPSFAEGRFTTTIPSVRVPMGAMPQIAPFPNGGGTMVFPPNANGGNVFTFSSGNRQIGVGVSALGKQLGDYFGIADGKGILISNVSENSPAAKAGLRAGDVIVEIDGKPVSGAFDLTRAINEKKEGDVTLTIVRNKNRQTFKVTPEAGKNNGLFEFYRQGEGNTVFTPSSRTFRRFVPGRASGGVRVQTAPRTMK